MKSPKILFLVISALIFNISGFAQETWKLVKYQDGIKIYTRTEEGSSYKSFKAVMYLTCHIGDVVCVIEDVNNYTKWMTGCRNVKLLKKVGNDQYHYAETYVPWPFENRDMVYHFHFIRAHDHVKVKIDGLRDYVPEKEGITRTEEVKGYWEVDSAGENKVKVTCMLHVEPGGLIPACLANSKIVDKPLNTFMALRNMVLAKK